MPIFIEEDGTGVVGSTSYLSVAEADEIISTLGLSSDWADFDEEEKEVFLNKGSYEFDQLMKWNSSLLDLQQGLDFPRVPFDDNNGRSVEGITFPIKRSVAMLTVSISEGDTSKSPIWITQQSFGDSSESYANPVMEEGSVFFDVALTLKRLGYGRSASAVVETFRA
jgi:hypothetical protein